MKIDWLLWAVVGMLGVTFGIQMWHYMELKDTVEAQHEVNLAVLENRALLSRIITQLSIGPRNTACDAKAMLNELRDKGIPMSPAVVETRCVE